ncbi:cyclic nucleotide-binding protein [Arachidicoccus ginsenosidimutans]|uniref:Crp/Fnr family transcriptional regulator n=1 Tax=Arachidicoccus sp. BS20 TaxID=1850526 RepID=UPI0007F1266E|nr:Crp/Fnr family transcriptional regulator [Arachidicoccus sp. BS20]ANI88475.1 cyclic nucleotide-binding protein [Arachidicoccus sp. BS20]
MSDLPNTTLQHIYRSNILTSKILEEVFRAHTEVVFQKNEFLLKEDQTANEYYCLENGLVRSFVHDYKGNDITTQFFCNNEIVIEVNSLFLQIPAKENIQALTPCKCWKITLEDFQHLYQTIPEIAEWGRAWMSQRLFLLKQCSVSMITDSATDRYLALQKEHPQILREAPIKDIASYLGITDTSLSRIRKEVAKA